MDIEHSENERPEPHPNEPPQSDALNNTPAVRKLLKTSARRFVQARDRGREQNAKGVEAVRTAGAQGIRPGVFRLGVALQEMDQRQRDRWFSEFELLVESLEFPVQSRLPWPVPPPREES